MTAVIVHQSPPVTNPSRMRKTAPWWVCPSTRELSLRSEINIGYSTVGSRIAKNKHSPLLGLTVFKMSEKEINTIKTVLAKAREMERINQIRSEALLMEYEQLHKSCRGNGESNCILCGYDPVNNEKKLDLVTCDKCGKIACTTCYQAKRLLTGSILTLCKLCYDYQELWCKTGAWMTNILPQSVISEKEMEAYRDEGRRGTRGSGGLLGLSFDQDFLAHDDDGEDSEEDLLEVDTISSYKNVKFTEMEEGGSKSKSPTPMAMIAEMSQLGAPSPTDKRKSLLEPRSRLVSSDNRNKLSEIRDKVRNKIQNESGTVSNNLMKPVILTGASFDSLDSDFEPLKIHESLDEKDDDLSIIISVPDVSELSSVQETEEEALNESNSNDITSSDNSDFEYDDIELPRGMSFLRFGATRAPVRIASAEKSKNTENESMASESEKEIEQSNDEEKKEDDAIQEKKNIKEQEMEEVLSEVEEVSRVFRKQDNVMEEKQELANKEDQNTTGLMNEDSDDSAQMIDIPDNVVTSAYSPDNFTICTPTEMDIFDGIKQDVTNIMDTHQDITQSKVDETIEATMEDDNDTTGQPQDITDTVTTVTTTTHEEDPYHDNTSSTSSSAANSPKKNLKSSQVLTTSEEVAGQDTRQEATGSSFRWKRRNATRSAVAGRGLTSTTDNAEGGSVSKDSSLLSKRDKARLAAKRLRERKGIMSSLRSKRDQQDDEDILEFVSPPLSPQINNDNDGGNSKYLI